MIELQRRYHDIDLMFCASLFTYQQASPSPAAPKSQYMEATRCRIILNSSITRPPKDSPELNSKGLLVPNVLRQSNTEVLGGSRDRRWGEPGRWLNEPPPEYTRSLSSGCRPPPQDSDVGSLQRRFQQQPPQARPHPTANINGYCGPHALDPIFPTLRAQLVPPPMGRLVLDAPVSPSATKLSPDRNRGERLCGLLCCGCGGIAATRIVVPFGVRCVYFFPAVVVRICCSFCCLLLRSLSLVFLWVLPILLRWLWADQTFALLLFAAVVVLCRFAWFGPRFSLLLV